MVDAPTPPPTTQPKRLWRIVLVLSLALNLAVIGLVVGSVLSGRIGDGPPRSYVLGHAPMARALTPQERLRVLRSLRRERVLRDFDPRRRIQDMVDSLQADPFEPDVLRALMQEHVSRTSDLQQKAQDALMQEILEMTPERRAAYAETLEQEMARPRRDGPRPGPSGG